MNAVEFVSRQYTRFERQLQGDSRERFTANTGGLIEAWLDDRVVPAAAEFLRSARIRKLARLPLQLFSSTAQGAERRAVLQADAALVSAAAALLELTNTSGLGRRLKALPKSPLLVRATFNIGADRCVSGAISGHDDVGLLICQCRAIEDRPWQDLFQRDDYFQPARRTIGEETAGDSVAVLTDARFLSVFNPKVPRLGNLATHCMLARFDYFFESVDELGRIVFRELKYVGRSPEKARDRWQSCWEQLTNARNELRSICLENADVLAIDAAIVLTQVIAGVAQAPDLNWLGVDDYDLNCAKGVLRSHLVNGRDQSLFDTIVHSLNEIIRFQNSLTPSESELDQALATSRLVVIEEAKQIYWQGNLIDCDFTRHDRLWRLFVMLARRANSGRSVEPNDFDTALGNSTLPNLVLRLKNHLQLPQLRSAIVSAGIRQYRLQLDVGAVHFIANRTRPSA